MKHAIRDGIIFVIAYSGLAWLYRQYMRRKGPLVRVLCFHDVPDKKWFESIVSMLVKDYNVITPNQFHTKEFNSNKINILLTFDDGYQSWVDNCLPVMDKYRVKGIFFVNSGLLDISDDEVSVGKYMKERLLISPKKALSWGGVEQLVLNGHTIGGHTVNHPRLSQLTNEAAYVEITDDKIRIESKLKLKLIDFAYPFGQYSDIKNNTISILNDIGYTFRYSSHSKFQLSSDGLIKRTLLDANGMVSTRLWVSGSYDVFTILKLFL